MAKRPPLNNRINKEDMFKKIMPSSSARPKPAESPLPGFGASDDLLDGFSDSLIESSVDAFTDELLNQLPSQPRVFATPAAPTAPVPPPAPADFPDEDFDDRPEPPQIQPSAQTDTQPLGRREAQQVAPPPMLQFTPQQPDQQGAPQFAEQPLQQPNQQSTPQFAQQPVQQPDQQSAPQFAQQPLQQPNQQSTPQFAQQPLQQPDQQSAPQFAQQPVQQPNQQSTPQFAQQPLQQPNQQNAPQFAQQQPMWQPDQTWTPPFAGQPMQPFAQPYYAPQYPGQQFPQPPQNPWGAPPMAAQQSYAGMPFPGTPVQQPYPYPQAAYPPPEQQAWAPEQKTSATVVADSASVVTESVVIQELHSEASPASPTPAAPVKPPEPPAAPVELPEPEHHIQLDLDIPVSTLLNDYDAFPPLAESSGDFVNVAERIVSAWLDDVIRTIHGCTCEVCRLDIAAYALNRLTPRYVLTEDLTEEALTSRRVVAETVNMLYQAAFQVKECPRH